jgi:uncharacterized protein
VFQWDEKKSRENRRKHGFFFNEILDVFNDPYLNEIYDTNHSADGEDRYKCIGCLEGFLIVLVVISDKNGIRRIISARRATPKEKAFYYDTIKETT